MYRKGSRYVTYCTVEKGLKSKTPNKNKYIKGALNSPVGRDNLSVGKEVFGQTRGN